MGFISFRGAKIFFNEAGQGKTLVLLHGFTESSEIWDKFIEDLSQKLRVIRIDLPGHGKSGNIADVHTMELQAEMISEVLNHLKVEKCTMIGHSMGGYVTLAFAEKYPAMLKGFGLFHSHPFADNEEQKISRDRATRVAENNKAGFLSAFIPELFPEEVRAKWSSEIKKLVADSASMTKEGVIASLQGMKLRRDMTHLLERTNLPVLMIIGMKDIKFPLARLEEMLRLPHELHCLFLKNTGHMGYIEEEEATMRTVEGFVSMIS